MEDEPRALACLKRIGYYRLSGYAYPFRLPAQTGKSGSVIADGFNPGTKFSSFLDLYVFDKKLRMLMLDAIERVEVGLRVAIGDILGQRNPGAHLDPVELHGNFAKKLGPKGRTKHDEWLDRYHASVNRSHEAFIAHFRAKYPGQDLPIWIAIEVWDFGLMSRFLEGMKHADRQCLAKGFDIPREELLVSWVRAINNVRNACAHHSRLWNAPLVDYPKPAKTGEISLLDHVAGDVNAHTRLYYTAAALRYLLLKINPSSSWSQRLQQHLSTLPEVHPLAISQMGFPANWCLERLWK